MLLSVAALFSCERRHKPFDPPEPTYIQLENVGEMVVGPEAGEGEYFYTILNPIPTATLKVEPDKETDWIHDIDLSKEGRVGFTYEANTTGRIRVAYLNMTYSTVRTSMVIKQLREEAPATEAN